ncbi:PTS system mannose/fructose/sorbose family transporter subunit IID [Tetragenococcus halophilus]|uniref:PTS system mannose/fructose/sorbose family transporter subunit IID n=1 Tax=Tetragenococcus halophilus TaxID=51669 RepID=UPI0015BBDDBD|nr:PTS system mannose/fructose/sorbose family transporter subunit IID [Tetragenococcus halophilus]MCO8292567.1 PTS system mannose/fructose/sorbose family transporter subunit IID [Tetragenococcus halophilus]NWN99644.1 PTS system mannose/fructose/sorbose family transporter subunit IID [Tetragenococcus halophilus]
MENTITKKELNRVFWRSQLIQFSHNYERMQSLGTLYGLTPVLERLYKDRTKEEKVEAQRRHLEFFNSHPALVPFILGVSAALEENTEEDEKESVIAIKTSLMGPLAGLGDSLLNFTWFPIAGSIGASFAVDGNFLGPILMFVMINALYFPLKYYGVHLGYSKGRDLLTSSNGKKILDRVSTSANVLGVMVTGALIASIVNITLGLQYGSGETAINVQEMLDEVMPNLLPISITMLCLYLLKKWNGKHVVALIFTIIFSAIALSGLGILE